MLFDLMSQLSLGLQLYTRFPGPSDLPSLRTYKPRLQSTYQGSVLRELGHRAALDAFRAPNPENGDHHHGSRSSRARSSEEKSTSRKRSNSSKHRPSTQEGAKSLLGLEGATLIVLPLPRSNSSCQDLYAKLGDILKEIVGKSCAEAPADSDQHGTHDGQDGEGPAREEHNGEYTEAEGDKSETAGQRPGSRNHLSTTMGDDDECADMQPPSASGSPDWIINQDNDIVDEQEQGVSAPIWAPRTPPNAFHITTYTPSPSTNRKLDAIRFRPFGIQESEDLERTSIVSPRTMVRVSEEEERIGRDHFVPCDGSRSADSWGNGIFDHKDDLISEARPEGANYFPVWRGRKMVYELFHKAPPFHPFMDRTFLSTPSVRSEDEDCDLDSPTPWARNGKAKAHIFDFDAIDRGYGSKKEKPPVASNPFRPFDRHQGHGAQSKEGAMSGRPGGPLQGESNHRLPKFTDTTNLQRANERLWSSMKTSGPGSPATGPENLSTYPSNMPGKPAKDVGDILTQPFPDQTNEPSKRRGSELEINEDPLRPRWKHPLYERPQDHSSSNDHQSTQATVTPWTMKGGKETKDIGDWLTRPFPTESNRKHITFEVDQNSSRPLRKHRLYERPGDRSLKQDETRQGTASTLATQDGAYATSGLNAGNDAPSSTLRALGQQFQTLGQPNPYSQVPFNQARGATDQQGVVGLRPVLAESMQRIDRTNPGNFRTSREIVSNVGCPWPVFSKEAPMKIPEWIRANELSTVHPGVPPTVFARAGNTKLNKPKPERTLQPEVDRLETTATQGDRSGADGFHEVSLS